MSKRANIISFLLLCLPLCLPSSLHAAPKNPSSCAHLFALTGEELAGPKADFLARHTTHYTTELAVTDVKDQCSLGSCWVYSTTGNIESSHLARTGKKVSLSEPYLILRSLEERIDEALSKTGAKVIEGGWLDGATNLINRHGILPTAVWQPRVPFEKSPHAGRLLTFINTRISQYHFDLANKAGPKKLLLRQARKDIESLLHAYIGKPPARFVHEGISYESPKKFAATFAPDVPEMPLVLYPQSGKLPDSLEKAAPAAGTNINAAGARAPKHFLYVPREKLEEVVAATLATGKSVPIMAEINNAFIDKKTGIMAIGAFHAPAGFRPMPTDYRQAFGFSGGLHQMEVVGVELDANGKAVKFKIKNSWGEKFGDAGFYHMYSDYFRTYITSVYVTHPPKSK